MAAAASIAVTAAILASQAFLLHSASSAWNGEPAAAQEATISQAEQAALRHLATHG